MAAVRSHTGSRVLILVMALIVAAAAAWQFRALGAVPDDDDWPLHGRSADEARFSPLTDINAANVNKLGLAWSVDIEPNRGLESTPIVIDGVMYVTAPWSIVYALDAETGRELWRYDPEVDRGITNRGCCGPANRGVAVTNGMVYASVFDGRLVALDARTGKLAWSVDTIADHTRNYTITGAPRLAGRNVVIGNGGAEYGVRGYVSAYDLQTGKLAWRFFTVPGDPNAPDASSKAMQIARKTWHGNAYVAQGGGGTAWDSMVYDPELNILYVGTGNSSLWSRKLRSEGKGDNLFVSSIVAINPDTGEYLWHYQTTPGDEWDYTATQNMILADLKIDGQVRKVIMQAPKNGFFYVLDRRTGAFISGKNFVPVNWAKGIDENGRPVIDEAAARYEDGALRLVQPANLGAHSWHPMSFDPRTGLVYIPASVNAMYIQDAQAGNYRLGQMNVGVIATMAATPTGDPRERAGIPDFSQTAEQKRVANSWQGRLIAWDPVAQRAVWTKTYAQSTNGGVLSTAGDLVFQGTADGRLVAYRATDGKELWAAPARTGVVAPPITYRVKGTQYIAVAAGWGGVYPMAMGSVAQFAGVRTQARILVYKLGGTASVPPPAASLPAPSQLAWNGNVAQAQAGQLSFAINCAICHGFDAVSGGEVPDVRRMSPETFEAFSAIVKGGFAGQGMPDFSDRLTDAQIEEVRQYVAMRNADLRAGRGKE